MASIQVRKETGCLIMDFYFQGFRCREQTALPDTAANRKKVQKLLDRIEADIAAGTFDYRRYFPASKNAARFDAAPAVSVAVTVTAPSAPAAPPTPLFKDFAETWYLEKEGTHFSAQEANAHLDARLGKAGFRHDMDTLLRPGLPAFDVDRAGEIVREAYFRHLR